MTTITTRSGKGSALTHQELDDNFSNLNSTKLETSGNVSQTGNVAVTGQISAAVVTATGNVSGNYFIGNGSQLTGISAGSSYTDANVTTLLAAFGSNTVSTTGTVTAGAISATGNVNTGNINMTGRLYDTSGVFQIDSVGNIVLVPTGSTQATGDLSATGNITGANLVSTGGIFATGGASLTGTIYSATALSTGGLISATGRVTAGNVAYTNVDGTAGQVLTTYGNGVTYFSTVSGGGNGSPGGTDLQIQYNNAGAFAGIPNTAYYTANGKISLAGTTFEVSGANSIVTVPGSGNITLGNIVTNTNKIQTVSAIDLSTVTGFGTTTPFRITVGNAYLDGTANSIYTNISAGTVASPMNAVRLLSADAVSMPNNGGRYSQTNSTVWGIFSANISNANNRMSATRSEIYIGGGANNFVATANNTTTAAAHSSQVNVGRGTNANLSAVGNTVVTGVTAGFNGVTVNVGSQANLVIGVQAGLNGSDAVSGVYGTAGNVIAFSAGMPTGLGNTANVVTQTYVSYYHPSSNTANSPGGFGTGMGNMARNATNYFSFRSDDDLAQTRLGMLSRFHELNANTSTTSGSVTIDKTNGQVQTIYPTGDITSLTFSNFVPRVTRPNSTFANAADTVTLIIQQGATPYAVTMPTGNTQIRYAGGISAVSSTANTTTMISITGTYNYQTSANQYLVTISPEFS
jgi:hypothetical protein